MTARALLAASVMSLTSLVAAAAPYQTPDAVLAAAPASDWQSLDPADTLYMDLPAGRVVILLAPGFAPKTIANIKSLVAEKYFDDSFAAALAGQLCRAMVAGEQSREESQGAA